jgi:hypothetical protein
MAMGKHSHIGFAISTEWFILGGLGYTPDVRVGLSCNTKPEKPNFAICIF